MPIPDTDGVRGKVRGDSRDVALSATPLGQSFVLRAKPVNFLRISPGLCCARPSPGCDGTVRAQKWTPRWSLGKSALVPSGPPDNIPGSSVEELRCGGRVMVNLHSDPRKVLVFVRKAGTNSRTPSSQQFHQRDKPSGASVRVHVPMKAPS